MSFLFGKKKGTQHREGTPTGPSSTNNITPTSSLNSSLNNIPSGSTDAGSPNSRALPTAGGPQKTHQSQNSDGSVTSPQTSRLLQQAPPNQSSNNASLYPWSQKRLALGPSHPSPFPRYGHAANAVSGKEGDIYIMGGLIRSQTVRGDLWMVEGGSERLDAYPVMTTSEGPGPRVGHASLLVGNAFIVFGGDTKLDERDVLDETLYLLNTSTRQWSRASPHGHRLPGRYGHTLNILGSKLYIFGGQVDTVFFNDLVAFDLNTLQHPGSKWEVLVPAIEGSADVPASRTNHTIVTWNERLYLFGGTNGTTWFNDVWSFDPRTNNWTSLDCIGFIPSAREGHAAALVGEVMYIFGGRSSDGTDLGDLAAFRIPTRRWYTFQNMGPSPSPRSGHSMTTVGTKVLVLGGEPSVATGSQELQLAYVLDTSKIRYPNDNPNLVSPTERAQNRDPRRAAPGMRNGSLENMGPGPDGRPAPRRGPRESVMAPPAAGNNIPPSAPSGSSPSAGGSRLPRASMATQSSGPPPTQQAPAPAPRGNGGSSKPVSVPGSQKSRENISPVQTRDNQPTAVNGRRTPTSQRKESRDAGSAPERSRSRQQHQVQRSIDSTNGQTQEEQTESQRQTAVQSRSQQQQQQQQRQQQQQQQQQQHQHQHQHQQQYQQQQEEAPPPASSKQASSQNVREHTDQPTVHDQTPDQSPAKTIPPAQPRDVLVVGPQGLSGPATSESAKEIDTLKRANDWYASELALARRAGYTPQTTSNLLDGKANEMLPENERPFVEAMLALKGELSKVQSQVETQAAQAAQRIQAIERQRDVAIQEAVYAKAKLAALGGSTPTPGDKPSDTASIDAEKMADMGRKLAASLGNQADLSAKVELLTQEITAEKKARRLADETASAAQSRISELDEYRNRAGSEIENLRAELLDAGKAFRDEVAIGQEAVAEVKLLKIDQVELEARLQQVTSESKNYKLYLEQLNQVMQTANAKSATLERQLEEERVEKERLERKLAQVKSEYEEKTADLHNVHQRLKDAEELITTYAEEAKAAQAALASELGKLNEKEVSDILGSAADDRVRVLNEQVETTKALLTKTKVQADETGEKLAEAMQRIAGLEYQQGQASKDSIALRRRMAEVGDEVQRLKQENAELTQRVNDKQLEVDAVTAKYHALKDILQERSNQHAQIFDKRRSTALQSPSPQSGTATPEQISRLRELEQRLEESLRAHYNTKTTAEMQAQEIEKHFRDKLEQLEHDYQHAVHYVKGTEKMLRRMKDQEAKLKASNARLQIELEEAQRMGSKQNEARSENEADWEQERELLNKEIDDLRAKVRESATALDKQIRETKTQLDTLRNERDQFKLEHNQLQLQLLDRSQELSQTKSQIEKLEGENALLENRAQSAEQKVSMLLDRFEDSVDAYRRSMRLEGTNGEPESARSSYYSGPDNRTSVALDSLASELDQLRNHWETTSKSYRLSNTFDFERTPTSPQLEFSSGAAQWRQKLQQVEEAARSASANANRDDMVSPVSPMKEGRNGLQPTAATSSAGGGVI